MKPCIDAIRTPPKRGCTTHIKKSRIGKVYVGMRDPDIDIENEGVKELRKVKIEVEDFPGELNQKIRLSLKEFIEFKEAEKLKKTRERKKKEAKPYLKQATKIVVNGNEKGVISGFSNKAIQQFISNSKATFNYPSKDFNNWAIGFELVTKAGNNMVATKMVLLLLGEEVDEIYSHSIFKVEIDYEDGKTEIKNITGPISLQLPKLIENY